MKRKMHEDERGQEVAVCIGMDALRLATGLPPTHFSIGEIRFWLASLQPQHVSPYTCDVCDKHPCECHF